MKINIAIATYYHSHDTELETKIYIVFDTGTNNKQDTGDKTATDRVFIIGAGNRLIWFVFS